jgi:hypothetical protein
LTIWGFYDKVIPNPECAAFSDHIQLLSRYQVHIGSNWEAIQTVKVNAQHFRYVLHLGLPERHGIIDHDSEVPRVLKSRAVQILAIILVIAGSAVNVTAFVSG